MKECDTFSFHAKIIAHKKHAAKILVSGGYLFWGNLNYWFSFWDRQQMPSFIV